MLRTTRTAGLLLVACGATALAVVTCGGKVVVDQGNAPGGGGGSSDATDVVTNGTTVTNGPVPDGPGPEGPGPGPGPGVGGSTTTGPMACVHCAEFISDQNPKEDLCPGSDQIFQTLVGCFCKVCQMECQGFCQGGPFDQSCGTCANNAVRGDCFEQFAACANDV